MADKINNLLEDFISLADGKKQSTGLWREEPVDLLTFFKSKDFLNERPYPGKQTELLERVNEVLWYKFTGDIKLCPADLREITEMVVMFGKGCKSGDTLITDPVTGITHTFRELYESGRKINVLALNEDTQKFVIADASEVVKVGKGEMYEVTTVSGHKTKVYTEHLFLSRNYIGSRNGKYKGVEWKKVKDLKKGDYIALARNSCVNAGLNVDFNELRLVGYLLGDGNISDSTKCTFFSSVKEVEEDYCSILRYYGVEPKYPRYANNSRPDRNCVAIESSLTPWESRNMGENPITKITRKYNIQGSNAYSKRIPREFLNLNRECIIEFLRALFATDGWVTLLNGRTPQIGYCSVSYELVKDISLMLRRLGIISRIDTKKTNSAFGVAYQLTINSEVDFRKFCDQIKIIGKEAKQEYVLSNMKVSGKRKDTDIYFDKIKSIEYVGEDYYFDLTVDNYSNYVSDGFVDHNSGKDFLISGILAYVCYLLCCMRDPHEYFGFGQDEPIDLINVAINAYQANNVFFKKLKARLSSCKWFKKVGYNPAEHEGAMPNEYQITKQQIRFYKNITAHSAHSDADSFEGFNPLVVIFDEIGGFELDKAEDCYTTLRSSASTRFKDKMLLIFISFPRQSDDYMMKKYKEAVDSKDPQVFAMIGKSWEVNPRITRASLEKDYNTDPEGSKMKYESLTKNTIIWTPDGAYRIDELGDNSIIRTMFGAREVQMFINSGSKSVYELRTKEGYTIRGSANHPLKVYANKKNWKESSGFVWRTIGELRKGDKVYLDLNNDLFGEETISKEMALLMGGLIADGTFQVTPEGKGYATWYFCKNSELLDIYREAFIKEFGHEPQVHSYPSRTDTTMRTTVISTISRLLESGLKYGNVYSKEIPMTIFRQPKEIICEFVKGMFDADGHVLKSQGTVSLFTCNYNLAKQVQQLLLMIGVRSRIWHRPANNKGKIKSGEGWIVALSKQESVVFNNLIELNTSYKRDAQQKCKSWDVCNNYKYQLPFCTVEEVVYCGEETCYDLWVEPENEFTANGMVAHNCIPPAYRDGLFQFPEKIDECVITGKNAQCTGLIIQEKITTRTLNTGEQRHFVGLEIYNLNLNPAYVYYLGGDGGVINDSYILTLFHAEPVLVSMIEDGKTVEKWFNKPVEDLILEWRPSKKDRLPVDLLNVADVVEMICKQVFVKKALFDKFNSAEVVQRLMVYGVEAEDKNWSNPFQLQIYQNFKGLIYTGQVDLLDYTSPYQGIYPNILNPNDELKSIKIINGNKIDHDSDKSKDFSDARAGAIWICTTDEPQAVEHYAMPEIAGAKRK